MANLDAYQQFELPATWYLDKAFLQTQFQLLSQKYHPDTVSGDVELFKNLNDAYQILKCDSERLKYRLEKAGYPLKGIGQFSEKLMDLFSEISDCLMKKKQLIQQLEQKKSSLAKATLEPQKCEQRVQIQKMLSQINQVFAEKTEQLKELDRLDLRESVYHQASKISYDLSFLEKWKQELQTGLYQLI